MSKAFEKLQASAVLLRAQFHREPKKEMRDIALQLSMLIQVCVLGLYILLFISGVSVAQLKPLFMLIVVLMPMAAYFYPKLFLNSLGKKYAKMRFENYLAWTVCVFDLVQVLKEENGNNFRLLTQHLNQAEIKKLNMFLPEGEQLQSVESA